MAKILKNNTASDIDLNILGRRIPASGQLELDTSDFLKLSNIDSISELTPLINNGDIVLNNGTQDLSISQSLIFIKFPTESKNVLFNNGLNGFNAQDVQTAIEEAKEIALGVAPVYYESKAENLVSTTSSTFQNIPNMTLTPPEGTYLVSFSGNTDTTGVNTEAEFRLLVGGSAQADSLRQLRSNANILGLVTLSTNNIGVPATITAIVTVDGEQSIIAQYRELTSGSIRVAHRSLTAVRVIPEGEFISQLPQPATASHSALQNLTNDDHPQYLRTDGSRALTGNLNLNSNELQNVSNINGIVPESHASRHNPGGADALATGTAVSTSTTNAEGNSTAFARSNHTHNTVIQQFNVRQTGEVQTNSTNDVQLQDMIITPNVAGTYLYIAGASFKHFNASRIVYFSLYKNSSQEASTLSQFTNGTNNQAREVQQMWTTTGIVQLNGTTDSFGIRWRSSSGTARAFLRFLTLVRIGD